jgi:L-seryl-tRNA(Ser) seleniumtransferase
MPDLRKIPSIDRLLNREDVRAWQQQFSRDQVVSSLRSAVAEAREALRLQADVPATDSIVQRAEELLRASMQPSLLPVINATGIILHTNLGRAALSPRALQQVQQICAGYSNLELDLATGERGHRHLHLEKLWQRLTGAEASLAVNNCAAALLLIVDELARGREVIVSRGELVEIGGSFRIPDVLARGGAVLREVGTTNRTYVKDFAAALTPDTGMLLSTHLSNFRQEGFTHAPEPRELVALARQHGVISVLDLGSGLLSPEEFAPDEPTIRGSLAEGWDLVAFSGDKLLGGAQAGFVLGRSDLVSRLQKNPWMRALRLDKLRLAALQGTLLDWMTDPAVVPTVAMLRASSETLKQRAQALLRRLKKRLPAELGLDVRPCESSIGGGTTPGQLLPSWAVCLQTASLDDFAARLRTGSPAVLTRRHQGCLWLDMRTVPDSELIALEQAIVRVAVP